MYRQRVLVKSLQIVETFNSVSVIATDKTGTLTTGGALKVYVDKPLRYAFTTSATVTMKRPISSGVIQFPATTPTGIAVGVAHYAITAANY